MKHSILVPSILGFLSRETASFAFHLPKPRRAPSQRLLASRRDAVEVVVGAVAVAGAALAAGPSAASAAAAVQDSLSVDDFLRTGVDGGGNMGVSSQAGKSRPVTGVVFRDGTEVLQVCQHYSRTFSGLCGMAQPFR